MLAVHRFQRGVSCKPSKARGEIGSRARRGGVPQRALMASACSWEPTVTEAKRSCSLVFLRDELRFLSKPRNPWGIPDTPPRVSLPLGDTRPRAFPSGWIFIASGAAPDIRWQHMGSNWRMAKRQNLLKPSKKPNIQAFFPSPQMKRNEVPFGQCLCKDVRAIPVLWYCRKA